MTDDQSHCRRCGQCCRHMGLTPPWPPGDNPLSKWNLIARWLMQALPLEMRQDKACMYLLSDNTCGIYNDRPKVCRKFKEVDEHGQCEIYGEPK